MYLLVLPLPWAELTCSLLPEQVKIKMSTGSQKVLKNSKQITFIWCVDIPVFQVDKRYHKPHGAWDSEEHIKQGTDILCQSITDIQKKFPTWSKEQQLKGRSLSALKCQLCNTPYTQKSRMVMLLNQALRTLNTSRLPC